VAQDGDWLGGTLYPSDLWVDGDTVRQVFCFVVPEWSPAPALYWVRLGLLDGDSRVTLMSSDSDMVVLGPWRMRAVSPTPSPGCVADYRLGEAIRLMGYDLELDEALKVTLYWEAKRAPEADYTVFVHLLGPDGRMLAQHDGPPREGAYPTSWWLPEQVIIDRHTIQLTEPLIGPARLLVGLYDPATLVRLPAYDDQGRRLPHDAIPLTQVTPQGDTSCASD
jgi:hypothetical protein